MTDLFLLTTRLAAIAILFQGLEFLLLRPVVANVWRFADLKEELGEARFFVNRLFQAALEETSFLILNLVRVGRALSLLIAPHTLAVIILLACQLLTSVRWLGTFNGGSDAMTVVLLVSVGLGLLKPAAVPIACWFLTFHLCLSYFKAGFAKLRNSRWRDGTALREILLSPVYAPSSGLKVISDFSLTRVMAAWAVISFEMSFPLSLLHPRLAFAYMALGTVFHLANVYAFGLNRFFWAWIAAYPALLYCATR